MCSFTLAVERNYKGADGKKQTDFIDIVAWRQTAEFIAQYFDKGMQMAVEGALQVRSYEDRQGNKRKAVEVAAGQVYFAEGRRSDPSQGGSRRNSENAPPQADFEDAALTDGGELPF